MYYWLSQSIANIHPYLIKFPDLLDIIGSDFYSKVCNPFVEAVGSPLAGLIFYIFEALTDLIGKSDPFQSLETRLLVEYDEELNVCMIWK
jgi:hypothetical protein